MYDAHIVHETANETPLIYVDRHLLHEVTSPQAFDGLRAHNRLVRQPNKTFATMDHNVSTQTKDINASGEMARIQMQTLIKKLSAICYHTLRFKTSFPRYCPCYGTRTRHHFTRHDYRLW